MSNRLEYLKEYRKVNADKIRAYRLSRRDIDKQYQAIYRKGNSDYFKKYFKAYYLKNMEKKKLQSKKQRESNPEKYKLYMLAYYEANKSEFRKKARQWLKENPSYRRLVYARRRARIKQVGGKIRHKDILSLKERQKGKCYWCKKNYGEHYHLDHVWPISKNGSNGADNIVISCPECNVRKSNKTPMEFAGMLL